MKRENSPFFSVIPTVILVAGYVRRVVLLSSKTLFVRRVGQLLAALAVLMLPLSAVALADPGPQTRAGSDISGPLYNQPAPRKGAGFEWNHNINGMTQHWLGAFQGPDGRSEYCLNLDSPAPTGEGTIVTDFSPNPVPGILGDFQIGSNANMGWIFKQVDAGRWDENDPVVQAAIALIVHANYEVGGGRDHVAQLVLDVMDSSDPQIRLKVQEMVAAAKASAAVEVIPGDVVVSASQMDFTVTNVGYKTASGAWVEGIPYTFTIPASMQAVFSNGQKTISGITPNGPITLTGRATGNTTGHISYRFWKNSVAIELRDRLGSQTTLRPQIDDPGIVSGQTRDFDLLYDFQPLVSSLAVSKFVDAGANFSDDIQVVVDPGYGDGTWTVKNGSFVPVTVITDLYYAGITAPASSAAVAPGAVKVGSATSIFSGPGTQRINIQTDGRGGYYVAKSRILKSEQPSAFAVYIHADNTYNYGLANETTVMQIHPTITTQASDKLVIPGQKTSDKVTVHLKDGEKWPTGLKLKATGTRYGPFDTPLATSLTASGTVDGTANLEFTADGQTIEVEWTPSVVGAYTWQWQIDKAAQTNPDLFASGFRDDFMLPLETTYSRARITHYSAAREYNVEADGRAFDEIDISGLQASHGEYSGDDYWLADVKEATVTVYDAGIGTDWTTVGSEVPDTATVHWQTTVPSVNGHFSVGYDDADQITGFSAGHDYVFVYSFAGDDRVVSFTSGFDDPRERFHVPGEPKGGTPSVATSAKAEVWVGEEFSDTALVVGDVVGKKYTVSFAAYGPMDGDIDADNPGEPFFTSDPIKVDATGFYDSPNITVDEPGMVYWQATLKDKDGKIVAQDKLGMKYETTKVKDYRVSTKALETVSLGGKAYDTAIVSGEIPEGTKLTFEAFSEKYDDKGNPVCEKANRIGETEYGDLIDAPGEYKSGGVVFSKDQLTFDASGVATVWWVETATPADGENVKVGECGLNTETTKVTDTPVVASDGAGDGAGRSSGLARTGASGGTIALIALLLGLVGLGVVVARKRTAGTE